MEKGYVQIYTGNGKGKTTAALGLVFRACGQGLRVKIVQFLKSRECGELHAAAHLASLEIVRGKGSRKFSKVWTDEDRDKIREESLVLLERARQWLRSGEVDVLILDEVMGAIKCEVIMLDEVLAILDMRPDDVELVMTGRDAPEGLVERADLVTEMVDRKHYFDQGVRARRGIEY